jgi:hypothetical protein
MALSTCFRPSSYLSRVIAMAKKKQVHGYRWRHICNTHHVSIVTQPDASSKRDASNERVAVDAAAKRFCDVCNLLIHIGSDSERDTEKPPADLAISRVSGRPCRSSVRKRTRLESDPVCLACDLPVPAGQALMCLACFELVCHHAYARHRHSFQVFPGSPSVLWFH